MYYAAVLLEGQGLSNRAIGAPTVIAGIAPYLVTRFIGLENTSPRAKCYDFLFSTLQMRIRRSFPIFVGVLLVAAALTIIVQLRKHAPPEPALLLPGADGFLYVNLKWMRRINTGAQLPPVSHDPEYEQFIQATGFQFERDLDQAAFAIHYPTRAGPS